MENAFYYNSYTDDIGYECDLEEERMTRQQMEELQEELCRRKLEYERKNKKYISEQRKEAVHRYY